MTNIYDNICHICGVWFYTHIYNVKDTLYKWKLLILFFKLSQAQVYGIESYKKKTPKPALPPPKMNIFCVRDKKLLSSLFNQTF